MYIKLVRDCGGPITSLIAIAVEKAVVRKFDDNNEFMNLRELVEYSSIVRIKAILSKHKNYTDKVLNNQHYCLCRDINLLDCFLGE